MSDAARVRDALARIAARCDDEVLVGLADELDAAAGKTRATARELFVEARFRVRAGHCPDARLSTEELVGGRRRAG